jgi:protein-S-isoprenylcysteine O-methyltransferase Ste14
VSRLLRITLWPVLVALPMIAASLSPSRFFADARCIAFFVFMILGLAIENAIVHPDSVAASNDRTQAKRDRKSFELSALTNVACFYLPIYDYMNLSPVVPRNTATLAIGLVLMIVGEGMRIVALRTLGRFFTMRVAVLDGHKVVRDGLYRFVRHPAYTGWFLLSLGVGVFFGSIVGVLGTTLFVVVLGWRVKVEEEALTSSLGDDYARYKAEVKSRFLPGIF